MKAIDLFYPDHQAFPIIDNHELYFEVSEFIDRLHDRGLFQIDNIAMNKFDNGLISIEVNWSMPKESYKTKKLNQYSFSRFKYCSRISTTYSDYVAVDINFHDIKSQKYTAHLSIGLYSLGEDKQKYDFSHIQQTKYGVNVWFVPNGLKAVERVNWILSKSERELVEKIRFNNRERETKELQNNVQQ